MKNVVSTETIVVSRGIVVDATMTVMTMMDNCTDAAQNEIFSLSHGIEHDSVGAPPAFPR